MGYPRVPMASLWPNGGNKTIWGNIQAKNIFFFQKNTLCHSFRIIVIPLILLSFLLDYCQSFRITVIPSGLLSFLPDYCHSFRISVIPSKYFKYLSSWIAPVLTLPYPKGEKNGHRRWPYMRVAIRILVSFMFAFRQKKGNCTKYILGQ